MAGGSSERNLQMERDALHRAGAGPSRQQHVPLHSSDLTTANFPTTRPMVLVLAGSTLEPISMGWGLGTIVSPEGAHV